MLELTSTLPTEPASSNWVTDDEFENQKAHLSGPFPFPTAAPLIIVVLILVRLQRPCWEKP
jgi:hypothetical protein